LADTGYQVIYDVEDTHFEIFSGDWILSKTGSCLYSFYYVINGPGTGAGKGRWTVEGLPQGSYLIEYWADNGDYAADARYQVISADGVQEVTANMNYVAAGWYSLGTFNCNRTCVVNISDYWTGAGTKLSVDALRFTYQGTLPSPPVTGVTPHIGVVIDDAGSVNPTTSGQPIYRMLRLPFPLTIAVLPYRSYTNQTAEEVYARGSEVILHQPMAAISVPNPGTGGISDSMTLAQVRSTVETNLDNLPHCIGMNNHMGSLITQQTDKMQVVVEELKERDLFWYDSRTITTSVAYDVAKDNGILTAERDLFIDGSSKDQSKALIRSLAMRALNAPNVPHLAIGHVRTDTASALEEMVAELDAMGVEIWPISRCVAQVVEADNVPSGCSFTTEGTWSNDSGDAYSKQLYDDFCKIVPDASLTQSDKATFTPDLQIDGDYDIYAIWSVDPNNATQVTARIKHQFGTAVVNIDQSQTFYDWYYLGRYTCPAETSSTVELNDSLCTQSGKPIKADAVRFERVGPPSTASVNLWQIY